MVDVFIASLYRQGHIVKTVESLWKNPQVSTITVVLNNYTNEQYRDVFAGLKGCTIIRGNNKKEQRKVKIFQPSKNPLLRPVMTTLSTRPTTLIVFWLERKSTKP